MKDVRNEVFYVRYLRMSAGHRRDIVFVYLFISRRALAFFDPWYSKATFILDDVTNPVARVI